MSQRRNHFTPFVALGLLLLVPSLSTAAERTFAETYPLEKGGSVELSNINGDVRITGWDRQEVQVEATISSGSRSSVDDVEIDVDATRGRISIEAEYKNKNNRGWRYRNADVEFRLKVPRTARLDEISLVNGSLELEGVAGEVEISLVNGNLEARGLTGNAELATVNGSIDAYFSNLDRDVDVESVNGSIDVYLPAGIDADVDASTVHGRIRNDFGLEVDDSGYVGQELRGRIGSGGARISLENVNGSISIHEN
ncbi:MAG: DUF4097 family beta strand repeat-containing protein [Holophagales bacterium]|nr:DUF4097 family beta strand repeat-containing protein [Holophagales bacterium]